MEQLLTTKLYIPPTRPDLVLRPRLIARLNEGLHRKLTLISAPAGFGKTTLVSEWVQAMSKAAPPIAAMDAATPPMAIAWLSLDEGDNDLVHFLAYLIAAINRSKGIEASLGEGVLSMLQSPQQPPVETILISLINEIASIPDRISLVLDDYHLIDAQPVHDSLNFLIENIPPQMHLVIATREDPHLPLSRLRSRGQLTELRATDLRFTASEAAEFLNRVMGLNLSAEDISALETRTEGWIAGLQLASLALQGPAQQGPASMQGSKDASGFIKSFTGSHRYVLDYLIEEVLDQQSEDVQTFLLLTSILDRLNGSLCDALTGQDDGQKTLEMLERANLFIVPLDGEREWYRYHRLFADLLRQQLRHTPQEQIPKLHIQASEWHEQHGFVDEAIEHALRAENFERAAALIEKHVDVLWGRGEHTKLRRWMAGLPVELVFINPELCILQAWDLFTSGQQEAAERYLQAAEEAFDTCTNPTSEGSPVEQGQEPEPYRMKILGRAATIRAFLAFYRGDVQGINRYAHQALEYLPEQDLIFRSTATVVLGDAYSFIGNMESAYQVRSNALEMSKAAGNIYMILIASMKLATTMRQQGKLEHVIEICQYYLQQAQARGLSQTIVVGWLLAIWGEVLAELNDLDAAIQQAKKGAELTERGRDLAMIGWSNLCLMRVLFSRGELNAAEETIRKIEKIAQEYFVPPWITNLIAAWQARIWLAQDKLEAASQWIQERGLEPDGEYTLLKEMEHIVQARILITQGRLVEANALLQRLLNATVVGGRTSRSIEILILQALSLQEQGDMDQAITTLINALSLAEPGGFIRIFIDEGPPMARLLFEALSRRIAPDYVRRLLGAFPTAEERPTESPKSQAPASVLIEPLSEREIEVLQLIAKGLTNPEIATRLFLSTHTIKAHTRNIFGKLGVNNRTQAVARGRAVGLLSTT